MRAMLLNQAGSPLSLRERPIPQPGDGQVQLQVSACAVCRTDLHVVDGELPDPKLPLSHRTRNRRPRTRRRTRSVAVLQSAQRVGVPWLGWTCGECFYCLSGNENLCPKARFTGYTLDGGYAEYARSRRTLLRADSGIVPSDAEAAPLLCAGIDRLPFAGTRRGRKTPRDLRLRRRGAHRRAGCALPGPHGICVHPQRRHAGPGIRHAAGRALGRSVRRIVHRRNWTRPSFSRRSVRWCPPRCLPFERAGQWCAAEFT